MKKYNKVIGNYGEDLAIEYLRNNGYTIIEKNFKCRLGEIDIIARKNDIISFIEVKSRFSRNFGKALEAIDSKKRIRIIKAATYYLTITRTVNITGRFDSIEINFSKNDSTYNINHIVDAFRPYN